MNGARRSRQWWGAQAARKMAWEGKRVLIARAGQPHMRVELIQGAVTWSKLTPRGHKLQIITDELWGGK